MEGVSGLLKRLFVYLFLGAFVYFGVEGEELWPMTGWRLFSNVRTDAQTSWQVDYVDINGRSRPVPFDQMSWAYRGFPQILRGFPELSEEERSDVCSAWLSALKTIGIDSTQLEIHRATWRLSDRDGLRARPPNKSLAFRCSSHPVQEQ